MEVQCMLSQMKQKPQKEEQTMNRINRSKLLHQIVMTIKRYKSCCIEKKICPKMHFSHFSLFKASVATSFKFIYKPLLLESVLLLAQQLYSARGSLQLPARHSTSASHVTNIPVLTNSEASYS